MFCSVRFAPHGSQENSRAAFYSEVRCETYLTAVRSPPLSEIPLAGTSGIFRDVTGKQGMPVIMEVVREIVILIATSEVPAAFALTHSSSLSLSVKHSLQIDYY